MTEFGPFYQEGHLSIESDDIIKKLDLSDCQVGVQVAYDGRIWVCVNGMSLLRFKPSAGQRYANIALGDRTLTPEDEVVIEELLGQ